MVCGIEGPIEAWHLAYLVGPRINAAGRLADAGTAVELLTTNDTARATQLAKELDQENLRRQEISGETLKQALEAIETGTAGPDPDGIVLASNVWHPGVIGIASAKLVERFHRPSALIAMDGDVGRGSVRSIRGIDVCAVLEECEDLLVQFGGHAMAAGLTIQRDHIAEFRRRFAAGITERITDEIKRPRLRIDGELRPEDANLELAADLDRLAPFGFGNPRPVMVLSRVLPRGRKVVGRGHLKLSLGRTHGPALDIIGFDLGERSDRDFPTGPVDLAGNLTVNEWNGRRTAQLQLLDYREPVR
jgi:single-stranded-DNA-specific exonuclease